MKIFALSLLCFLSTWVFAQTDTTQQIIAQRQNSAAQQQKPYVILISADGFRYDYAKKYNAQHLLELSKTGVAAESLIPSYPSITFPNHYTIVTGLYPSHHGLIANLFYDPKLKRTYYYKNNTNTQAIWYGGTPIWTLAEQQQMLSASFYWVGSEAPIKNLLPTYYYHYNEQININDRIQAVKKWLMLPPEKRPHLITFYLPEVDHISHKKGPEAPETEKMVQFIDQAVFELTKAVKNAGIDANFIFLSDHGMTGIPLKEGIDIPATIDTAYYKIYNEGVLVNVYAKNGIGNNVNGLYQTLLADAKGYSVYLKSNVPANLHYGAADDTYGRIGDIVLIPDYPHVFYPKSRKFDYGVHGFDPILVKDMQATFLAWGPNFKNNLTIPSFENVNIYPIITKILGLTATDKIDGTSAVADKIVSPPAP